MPSPIEDREQYLHRLVHDLRGPLNAIALGARALAYRESATEAEARVVATIRTNVDRLAGMIGRLLEPPPDTVPDPDGSPWVASSPAPDGPGLRVLLVEDNRDDAARLQRELSTADAGGFTVTCVDRLGTAMARVESEPYDVVLLDLYLPDSHGLGTLEAFRGHAGRAAIVVLTAVSDRQIAIEAVRSGAQDYLVKGEADGAVLARALAYAVERKRAIEEREQLISELTDALATVKRLSGLLPICAACKRIRDDVGSWQPVEEYVHDHSEADFSHGICPDCAERLYPGSF